MVLLAVLGVATVFHRSIATLFLPAPTAGEPSPSHEPAAPSSAR
jgi:hypothetical protein